ncbi:hypothetical protein QE152_g15501 [Popillia japonica]|uniref:Uncharacterized protein n=1 Tax=Popillia japonica TaxID=7064 RepID=A0AAW1L876_POPJA
MKEEITEDTGMIRDKRKQNQEETKALKERIKLMEQKWEKKKIAMIEKYERIEQPQKEQKQIELEKKTW